VSYEFETIGTRVDSGVLFATFDNPPINLIGRALVRDLIDLLDKLEHDTDINVIVFASADEEFFLPHVDIAHVADYTAETARICGSASGSLGGLLRARGFIASGTTRGPAERSSHAWPVCARTIPITTAKKVVLEGNAAKIAT
jgi:enoyl-CoA hydratase/carnithine racemase